MTNAIEEVIKVVVRLILLAPLAILNWNISLLEACGQFVKRPRGYLS